MKFSIDPLVTKVLPNVEIGYILASVPTTALLKKTGVIIDKISSNITLKHRHHNTSPLLDSLDGKEQYIIHSDDNNILSCYWHDKTSSKDNNFCKKLFFIDYFELLHQDLPTESYIQSFCKHIENKGGSLLQFGLINASNPEIILGCEIIKFNRARRLTALHI